MTNFSPKMPDKPWMPALGHNYTQIDGIDIAYSLDFVPSPKVKTKKKKKNDNTFC